jgi:hypothetical protein
MLADYQNTVYPIDRRLRMAGLISQSQSVCVAGDSFVGKAAAEDIEALDRLMAAITDEKLLGKDGETRKVIASMGGVREGGSLSKAD